MHGPLSYHAGVMQPPLVVQGRHVAQPILISILY